MFKLYTLLFTSCAAIAMVIDAPLPREISNPSIPLAPTTPLVPPPRRRGGTSRRQFRIRRTRASDLDAISTMLAMESVPTTAAWNWNDSMRRLRAKSQLEKQIAHRLDALEEGRKTAKRWKDDEDVCYLLSDDEICHQLWSNDNFRSKLKTAISYSQETNAWTTHNFDLLPNSDMLNHVMMSVEEISGDVVGFGEVAWLPSPINTSPSSCYLDNEFAIQRNDDRAQRLQVSDDSLDIPPSAYEETLQPFRESIPTYSYHCDDAPIIQCSPAIVNLVTSSSHRRMGIASRVLTFASKYINTQWHCCQQSYDMSTGLSLFVDPENISALKLYNKHGFSVVSSEGENGLLYMAQKIS